MSLEQLSKTVDFVQDATPSNANDGETYLDTSLSPPQLKVFDGSAGAFIRPRSIQNLDAPVSGAGAAVQIVGQFQLNNPSLIQSLDVSPQDTIPQGLAVKPDGSQLYVVGSSNENVYQYGLSTAFGVSTATFSQSFDVSPQDGRPEGLVFKPDGSQLYVVGRANDNVYQYGLSTAFDISTASFSQSFDVSPQDTIPQGLVFKPDGSQLYVVGRSNVNVYQYGLSTAFDISTASFSQSFDVSPQDGDPTGLVFKPDGSQLYVVGRTNDNVYQYAVGFVGAELG